MGELGSCAVAVNPRASIMRELIIHTANNKGLFLMVMEIPASS